MLLRRARCRSNAFWPTGIMAGLALACLTTIAALTPALAGPYGWGATSSETVAARIPPPSGFAREPLPAASFGAWLRGLPLQPEGAPVLLHNGSRKYNQSAQHAVVDIDVGTRDLQQCADAVMRLRAEWLLSHGATIAFNDTSGKRLTYRPGTTASRKSFGAYMTRVFAYAGTYSLARELKPRPVAAIAPGDVFIKGGFPGHAVLVVDVATGPGGAKRFLLLQSFMPAQSMHILKNPADPRSPWYELADGAPLLTPEWDFAPGSLKTW